MKETISQKMAKLGANLADCSQQLDTIKARLTEPSSLALSVQELCRILTKSFKLTEARRGLLRQIKECKDRTTREV